MRKDVKLADIAKEAGVSIATVSKVINGRPDVAKATRSRVEKLLDSAGYQKSLINTSKRNSIEVILERIDSVWSLEILQGVSEMAQENGLSVTLTMTGSDNEDRNQSWIYGTLERRPIGVIFVLLEGKEKEKHLLTSRNIPFVTVDSRGEAAGDSVTLRADNWTGGLLGTRHLISLGHTHIGIITGPKNMTCSRARYDGHCSAMSEAGIPVDPALKRSGKFTEDDGRTQAQSLLTTDHRPTAIFAGDDLQAMGVYEAARQLGISIPGDLSVVGFDNIRTSEYLGPALTTVEQPISEMARHAVELILQMRDGRKVQKETVFPTRLIVRNSTELLHQTRG